jgi:hypothetical protein
MDRPNYIREWRKQKLEWSQERLAFEATDRANKVFGQADSPEPYSWGRTDVVRYENGTREPPLAFMRAVASLCGVTIDDVLSRRPGDAPNVPPHLRELEPIWRDVADPALALDILKQMKRRG